MANKTQSRRARVQLPGIGSAITAIRRVPFQPLSHQYAAALQQGRKPWHPGRQLSLWHARAQQFVSFYLHAPAKMRRAQERTRKLKLRK